ncbi:siderophore-interacting protein [Cryptosporangium sp. NPDC051539]|uniref:siderophore-interacting protein n=1 Tax=Cryptosporangium sp. NPDC051539 TaxID=3363962 RepID=UPI0037AFF3EE
MRDQHDEIVHRFVWACRTGSGAALRAALDPDAVAICDGGGLLPAALSSVRGADDVADLVELLLCRAPDGELTVEAVNGRAGLALRRAGRAIAVVALASVEARISALWIVLNPAKLRGWHSDAP